MITPYYQDNLCTIYHGDCREILPQLEPVDLVLTDPPYGLGDRLSGGNGEWGKCFKVAPQWDKETVNIEIIQAIIGKSTNAIIWGGNYYSLPVCRGWLAWDKIQDHTGGHFELAWTNLDLPTRSFKKSRAEAYSRMQKIHPTQKPEDLMVWCIGLANNPQTILDPFMGSGTTLVAAKALGRKAIGIEIEQKYCDIAIKRLKQETIFSIGAA